MIKNIITILAIVAVAALGYYMFVLNQSSSLNDQDVSLNSDFRAQDFLNELSAISDIKLSTAVLSDPRLTNLVDNSTEVQPVEAGRSQPFSAR